MGMPQNHIYVRVLVCRSVHASSTTPATSLSLSQSHNWSDHLLLSAHMTAMVWSLAAVCALSRSPPIAARLATLRSLPGALMAALKSSEPQLRMHAAGKGV